MRRSYSTLSSITQQPSLNGPIHHSKPILTVLTHFKFLHGGLILPDTAYDTSTLLNVLQRWVSTLSHGARQRPQLPTVGDVITRVLRFSPIQSNSVHAGFTAVFPLGRTAAFTATACTQPSCRPLLRWEQLHARSPPLTGGRWSRSEGPGPWPLCGTCHGNWGRETTPLVFRLFCSVIQFTPVKWGLEGECHETIDIFQTPGYSKVWTTGYSSPGVELVHRSIHSHGDRQGFLAASLPHQVDDPSEPRAAHVSGACGNTLTDQTHDVTVQLGRQNAQRGQDVVDLFSVPSVTEMRKCKRHSGYITHIICQF